MSIPEEKLLAYADGRLSPEEMAEIDRQIATDPEARELLAALQGSNLPYREAAETLLPTPDLTSLEERLRTYQPVTAQPAQSSTRRFLPLAASIALFFVVGLLAGQHLFPPEKPKPTQWAVWVDRIASYQGLYSRATLSFRNPPQERVARQMARLSKALGAKLKAPDLTALAADFKYARMYRLDGQPLAQIAYLPKEGEPFSLCLMKTDKGDHGPRYDTAHGMNVATWRHRGIAYVFVGETPKDLMDRYISVVRAQSGA